MSEPTVASSSPNDDELLVWVQTSLPRAIAYARSLIRDEHTAEDVVHDCFCRLVEKRERYNLPRDGFRLLLRSITNAAIDWTRKRRPASLESIGASDHSVAYEPEDHREAAPGGEVMFRELEQVLANALRHLPVLQRAALELKSLGCPLSDIAQSLEISESHAGVLIHRARATVARRLQGYLNVES